MGGSAAVSGKVNTLPIGETLDLSVRIIHPEISQLLRTTGGYNPVSKVGSLDLQGRLIGGAKSISLKSIKGKFGNVDLFGDVFIGLGSVRPQINANLTGGKIVIDQFLPDKKSAFYWQGLRVRNVATRRGVSHWSTDPIDFSILADIDSNVILKSPSIKYKGYNFQNADLSISTKQGNLSTNKLTGVMFEGP